MSCWRRGPRRRGGSRSGPTPRVSRQRKDALRGSFCGLGLLFFAANLGSPYPKKHLRRAQSAHVKASPAKDLRVEPPSFIFERAVFIFFSSFHVCFLFSSFTLLNVLISAAVAFLSSDVSVLTRNCGDALQPRHTSLTQTLHNVKKRKKKILLFPPALSFQS